MSLEKSIERSRQRQKYRRIVRNIKLKCFEYEDFALNEKADRIMRKAETRCYGLCYELEFTVLKRLPVVADCWKSLRGCDVFRLLNCFDFNQHPKVASVILRHRPDLRRNVESALVEHESCYL